MSRLSSSIRAHAVVLVAGLFFFALVVPTAIATSHAHDAAIGRDPGIFQYTAWALMQGQIAYRDFHEINGPLPHLVHLLFLHLGGADEHVFRVLDTVAFTISYVIVGLIVPGLDLASLRARGGRARVMTHLAWAGATWCILSVHRMSFTWWDLSQREGFYNWFLLPSVALQLAAQGTHARTERARMIMFAIAGALVALPILGKPTCALFPVLLVLAIALDRDAKYGRRRAMLSYSAGVTLGLLAFAAIASRWCDLARWLHFIVFDSSRFYVYIMRNTLVGTYSAYGNGPKINLASGTLVFAVLLAWRGRVPSRFWTPVAFLFGALVAYFAQQKGFRYHLYPIVGAMLLLWIAALQYASSLWQADGKRGSFALLLTISVVAMYASIDDLAFAWTLRKQPAIGRLDPAHPRDFYAHYSGGNFFAWDTRRAATFVSANTPPTATVQVIGLDPYVLFLSHRLSASPFIYGWDLGDDSVLRAGPTPSDATWLRETFARNRGELLDALRNNPPGAFVFFDYAPPSFTADAETDFIARCKSAGAFMLAGYQMAHAFGTVRVWLRNDLFAAWQATGAPVAVNQ